MIIPRKQKGGGVFADNCQEVTLPVKLYKNRTRVLNLYKILEKKKPPVMSRRFLFLVRRTYADPR